MPINEEVFAFFTQSREGPIGREVESIAVDVANFARDNVRNILRADTAFGNTVAESVSYTMIEGTEAVIGIEDNGRVERYLAEKALREAPGWLEGALQEGTPT